MTCMQDTPTHTCPHTRGHPPPLMPALMPALTPALTPAFTPAFMPGLMPAYGCLPHTSAMCRPITVESQHPQTRALPQPLVVHDVEHERARVRVICRSKSICHGACAGWNALATKVATAAGIYNRPDGGSIG